MTVTRTRVLVDTWAAAWARSGSVSVWVGPLDGPAWVEHRSDDQHYAASMMKLALVMAAFEESDAGRLDLSQVVPVHNLFTSVAGGSYAVDEAEDSDAEVWRRMGEPVALRWLSYRAIVRSSNLATNLLLAGVGFAPVVRLLSDLGCSGSVFARGIDDCLAHDGGHHNQVTARELAVELRAVATGRVLAPESARELVDVLAAQQFDNALPRGLPPGSRIAHKSGWVPGVEHDAGVVYPPGRDPYVVSVCTTTSLPSHDAVSLVAEISRAAYADATA